MIDNPFAVIDRRINRLESLLLEIKEIIHSPASVVNDADIYGDFLWLRNTCPGIPASTLRIKSAAGEIPGVVKFGKRVLYEKALVLNWLRSQTKQPSNAALIDQQAEEQFNRQLGKRGGARV
ncbi:hypothetical protein [Spirosoma endophyticum]|uniref:Helix-turn-helix domain-containing protein n=1 Tax=Spirosoma endophyticum TaxID=662367 RepID=A0A1I2H6S4_9BACT|nr:hypothetical protein [Spirosoma endophyticum]SFF25894.1 hypothetical protein SAMN05216167_13915 [Spirosoma endophyticum]